MPKGSTVLTLHLWVEENQVSESAEATGTRSLYYVLPDIQENTINQFAIKMNIVDGKADIIKNMFNGTISGQGLAGMSKWDGTITINEAFDIVPVPSFKALNDLAANVNIENPIRDDINPLTESFGTVPIGNISALGFVDDVQALQVVTNYTFDTTKKALYNYDRTLVNTENNTFKLPSTFTYVGVEQSIDSGRMSVITIDTSNYVSIEEIEVK